MDVLINSARTLSQRICILNLHNICFKYPTILFVSKLLTNPYTPIKLKLLKLKLNFKNWIKKKKTTHRGLNVYKVPGIVLLPSHNTLNNNPKKVIPHLADEQIPGLDCKEISAKVIHLIRLSKSSNPHLSDSRAGFLNQLAGSQIMAVLRKLLGLKQKYSSNRFQCLLLRNPLNALN